MFDRTHFSVNYSVHPSKFYIGNAIVKLYKVPWKPVVIATTGKASLEFSLENNQVALMSGEVDNEILGPLISLIEQYFLPLQEIRRKKPD